MFGPGYNSSTNLVLLTKHNIMKMASDSEASCSNVEQYTSNFEVVKELVAAQLKKDGIQLWLAPYTNEETGNVGQFPMVQYYYVKFYCFSYCIHKTCFST